MIEINIKPLSVNEVWQGKRFKTNLYTKYEKNVMIILPKINMPEPPYRVIFVFYFSSKLADIDNPVKPFMDILQKKYKFNDKDVFELVIKKQIVKKGCEKIEFHIESINLENLF
jgi:Holliday junction resolvase RusA-like endonuclease